MVQLKGVGGAKIGLRRLAKHEKHDGAWGKLRQCWREAKTLRRGQKALIEGGLAEKAGMGGFTEHYGEALNNIKDERDLLTDEILKRPNEPKLVIASDKIVADDDEKTAIAEIITGDDALYGEKDATGARTTYSKNNELDERVGDKEYVKDDRGVYTRRFAYHEMNFYQMMDFILSGELTGRYQMFMSAGGSANTSPKNIDHPKNKSAVGQSKPKAPLTSEQVAVLHQWKGSGPFQSGVSLTSTAREEVRSNKGELFKTQGGFRLKIDLAKVAAEGSEGSVPLINDYSAKGVASNPSPNTKVSPDGYNFTLSAIKNRELYIERVKKDWVAEVVYHGASDIVTTMPEIQDAMGVGAGSRAEVKSIGIKEFLAGFEAGMEGRNYTGGGNQAQGAAGATTGKNALAGYRRGREKRRSAGDVPATPAEGLRELVQETVKKSEKEKAYDAHRAGYMRGRCTTEAMFASLQEYGAAIKG